MLRRTLWFVFSLFPVLSFALIFAARDPADLPVWQALLSAGVPVAIVEDIKSHWWVTFVGLVAVHYILFIVHPFFNRVVNGWRRKCAWAVSNLLFYPIAQPIYALLCIGDSRAQPKTEHRRGRAYSLHG
jgi:hypothetical protein